MFLVNVLFYHPTLKRKRCFVSVLGFRILKTNKSLLLLFRKKTKSKDTTEINLLSSVFNFFFFSAIKRTVLFLAIPTKYFWIYPIATQRNTIKFPLAKINIGGGYDSNTGVFTCPSDGYYIFHWSVTSTDSNKRCSSEIVMNGAEVIGNEIGGNQATFHMNRNDRAWIKATSNCTIVPYHSSFSGFKLI